MGGTSELDLLKAVERAAEGATSKEVEVLTLAPPEWNDEMEVHQLAYEVPYI